MDVEILQSAATYLQIGIAGVITAIVVEALKHGLIRWKGESWKWRSPLVIILAYITAVLVLFAGRQANMLDVSASTWYLILLQAVFVGAFATGGYEWVTKISRLAVDGFQAIRTVTNIDTQVNAETITEGDNINVGDMNDVANIAIGDEAHSDLNQQ